MEKPIVIQLQSEATDTNISITDLLRKAQIVASKLSIEEFRKWITNEMYGYKNEKVPEY
ncbi:hypothetical protein, partial [Leptospira semungkisensis]|uniref:AbiTii domain-containing protein n=1 Tax=Leptospira semungkisensis TaxID=2484985 RepID=UPI003CCC5B74